MPSQLDPWIEGYLEYLKEVRRVAYRTTIDIRCTLKRVSTALAKIRPGVALWKVDYANFLTWLEQERERGRSGNSLGKDLSHVRGLLDYSCRSGRSQRNALDGFQLQDTARRKPPRCLTVGEMKQLFTTCSRTNSVARCERVVLLLLYGCGLRTQELCQLDVQDIDRERREVVILHGKGDRQRRVPVPSGAWTELLEYVLERKGKRGALFRTATKHKRISSKDVCAIVQQTVRRAELGPGITAKTLRHTFATHLMDRGVDLAVIASLMGHRSPAETGVYLHVLPGKPRQAVDTLTRYRETGPVPGPRGNGDLR